MCLLSPALERSNQLPTSYMQLLWSLIALHTSCPFTHCSGRLPFPEVLLRLAAPSSTQLLASPSHRQASLLIPPLHTGAAEAHPALHACAATQLLASPLHRQASLLNPYTQVLLKLIQPYTRVRLPFISEKLNIPEKDVEQLLVSLILDNRISGYIDQVRGASVGLCGSVWSSW